MGTAADKILYLNETKVAIHDAIENKGVDIPSGSTFRSYADYIDNIGTGLLYTITGSAPDYFGTSFNATDTYIFAGAPLEGDGTYDNVGKIYVYYTLTGELSHTIENPLTGSNRENTYFGFGGSFGLSDRYLSVMINNSDMYLFDIFGNIIFNESDNNSACSITDDYILASRLSNYDSVYLYDTSNPSASPLIIDNPLNDAWSRFSNGIHMHDDYAIVSDMWAEVNGTSKVGRIYIYNLAGSIIHTLDNPTGNADEGFGTAMDTNSSHLITGPGYHPTPDTANVYLYNLSTGALDHTFSGTFLYGNDVAINDDFIAILSNDIVHVYDTSTFNLLYDIDVSYMRQKISIINGGYLIVGGNGSLDVYKL